MTDSDAAAALANVVADLREEGDALFSLLSDMDTGYWTQASTFKNWTVWDVVAHLHISDHMALTSLQGEEAFKTLLKDMQGGSLGNFTETWLSQDGKSPTGPELLARWRRLFLEMCDALAAADPTERFAWFGPGMKARMFATARQMETWAHGWEIYDLMGVPREHTDRLINIATIGVRTFGWTFNNRQIPVPDTVPYVDLQSPSGEQWAWGEESADNYVRGSAVDFCQVVTQVRNIADTNLEVAGDAAHAWMNIAQCFAGPPEDPPAPGSRVP